VPAVIPKEKHKQGQFKKFHAIDESGIARVGESLNNGDVFINKLVPSQMSDSGPVSSRQQAPPDVEYKARPEVYKGANPAYVDRVIMTSTSEDPYLIKVITRQTRVPEIGDKFSSRHGQKGVVGLIVP
jgi:DNA-directed RNA polymerase III subunit RPC2